MYNKRAMANAKLPAPLKISSQLVFLAKQKLNTTYKNPFTVEAFAGEDHFADLMCSSRGGFVAVSTSRRDLIDLLIGTMKLANGKELEVKHYEPCEDLAESWTVTLDIEDLK